MILKKVTLKNIVQLKELCRQAYTLNFHDHWNAGGLEWYLEKEFGNERLKVDLKDKNITYFFILYNQIPVGFIKLKINAVLDNSLKNISELEKIYILPKYKGMGIGKLALKTLIDKTKKNGKDYLILDVLDSNHSSIAFYKTFNFQFYGTTTLDVPYFKEELKGMHIMVKNLADKQ